MGILVPAVIALTMVGLFAAAWLRSTRGRTVTRLDAAGVALLATTAEG